MERRNLTPCKTNDEMAASLFNELSSLYEAFDSANDEIRDAYDTKDVSVKKGPHIEAFDREAFDEMLDSLSSFLEILYWDDVTLSDRVIEKIAHGIRVFGLHFGCLDEILDTVSWGDGRVPIIVDSIGALPTT